MLIGVFTFLLVFPLRFLQIVLQISSLGVAAFFVENIPDLQLNSIQLVTSIFSRYPKHRQLILDDILSSLARLPSSKKSLRNYKINRFVGGESFEVWRNECEMLAFFSFNNNPFRFPIFPLTAMTASK